MKCTRRNFIVAVTHTQILKINFSPSLLDPDKIKFQSYSRDLLELSCVIGIIYPSALKNFQSYTRTHARMRVQTHTTMVRKKKTHLNSAYVMDVQMKTPLVFTLGSGSVYGNVPITISVYSGI